MEGLVTAHTILFTGTTVMAVGLFLGLAIYVITRGSRQPISWIFSMLCLIVAIIYLSSLFLPSHPERAPVVLEFVLRFKWMAITFSGALYLHLVSFYFPPAWQRHRFWILLPAYLLGSGLALTILFTDLVLAGFHYHAPPHSVGPEPGPLMLLLAGLMTLEIIAGAAGLLISYRVTPSPSLRHQIRSLITPTGLILAGSVSHWLIVINDADHFPHELPDALLILAAFFYARTVIRYGSFVGRPLARRRLFYATLAAVVGLALLYLTISLDQWLQNHTFSPYPLATGILIVVWAAGFPTFSRWVTRRLDKLLFKAESREQEVAYQLAEALAQTPGLEQLQTELLATICAVLKVGSGFVALSTGGAPPKKLTIQAVEGNLKLKPGHLVHQPLEHHKPQLITALYPHLDHESDWQNIVLLCPLTINQNIEGVLALGEKLDGTPFSPREVGLCTALARQLDTIGQMMELREQRRRHLEEAHLQDLALQQLKEEIITTTRQTLTSWETPKAPLEVRLLGCLQVTRNGRLVAEADWGSEKAKRLLAYLLWKSPDGATREELSEALWPNRSLEETANVFHVTLHRLRRVLQPKPGAKGSPGYIVHDRGRYRFNLDAPHWLDVTEFQNRVKQRSDLQALKAAVELYRGSYMEDMTWTLPGEVEVERRRLEQLYADALRQLAARAKPRDAEIYLEKLLVVEPADETAYRTLVLSYLGRGRLNLAKQQALRWQQSLAELDLEPSPEAKTLWQKVTTFNGYSNSAVNP